MYLHYMQASVTLVIIVAKQALSHFIANEDVSSFRSLKQTWKFYQNTYT